MSKVNVKTANVVHSSFGPRPLYDNGNRVKGWSKPSAMCGVKVHCPMRFHDGNLPFERIVNPDEADYTSVPRFVTCRKCAKLYKKWYDEVCIPKWAWVLE